MKFSDALDEFIRDYRAAGRINSPATERSYRSILGRHMDDISNRDPRTVGREDIKTTLARWPKPNTQRVGRSVLMSFYTWAVEEGHRPNNPVAQTRRPKKQPTTVYRMTLGEVQAFLAAPENVIETRCAYLGVCAGGRNAELRGLRGEHFRRPGFIHFSKDIAKGSRERWVPVIPDLQPIWDEIRANVADDEYVFPAQRWRDPGLNQIKTSLTKRPMSAQGIYYLVERLASRAGIAGNVTPHTMRHAHGDHVARYAGLLVAQAMLGHKSVETTRSTYVGQVSLDELSAAVQTLSFATGQLPPLQGPSEARKAPTRIELVDSASRPPAGSHEAFGRILVSLREQFAEATS